MNTDLQAALSKLEAFTTKNPEDLPLNKTIGLMRAFFAAKLSDRKKEKQQSKLTQERTELLRAIDVLKDHLHLLDKLQKGTPQQQKLAASALSTIERFNALIDKAEQKGSTITARIRGFFQEHSGEMLPQSLPKIPSPARTFALNLPTSPSTTKVDHFSLKMVGANVQQIPFLTRQAVELFYMKTISLAEKKGFMTHMEARQAVRQGRISCQIDADPKTCTAQCHLEDFVIQIRFRKDAQDTYTCIDDSTLVLLKSVE